MHLRSMLVLLSLVACGGSLADGIDAGSDAATDAAQHDTSADVSPIFECPALTPGTPLYGFCLKSLVIEDKGGGFGPQPPPGSDCAMGQEKHEVDLTTHVTHDEQCLLSPIEGPYKLHKADRTLTDQEFTDLVAALKVARVASPTTCGADKSVVQLTVSTGTQSVTYTDSFYGCQGQGPYADGLDGVLAAFIKLK